VLQSLGNHEFDDGPSGLAPYLKNVSVPVLGCNVDFSADPILKNSPLSSSIVFTRGAFKIGVVGYITPETSVRKIIIIVIIWGNRA